MILYLRLKGHAGLIIVCLLFFILGLLRLNDLSLLNPDSSRYLIWGNSVAHGKGFIDMTQPEPDKYVVQAPLYPILIAPVELIFPLSLTAVKIWTLLWGILAITLFYFLMNRFVGKIGALASIILLVCNPLILIYSSEVLSDAPFIAFILLVFLLSEKYLLTENISPIHMAAIVGSVAAVALLREVGVSLVIASVVFYFFRRQRTVSWVIILVTGGLLGLWYLRNHIWIGPLPPSQGGNLMLISQHFVTPPDAPIINELALRMWEKGQEYFYQLCGMLIYPLFMAQQFRLNVNPSEFHQAMTVGMKSFGKFIVLALTIPMILFGIYLDIKKSKVSVLRLLFGVFYLTLVLIYPVHDVRFLLPLLPLMIFYFVISAQWFLQKFRLQERYTSPRYTVLVLVILMLPNISGIYEILKINLAYRESPVKFYERVRHLPAYPLMFTQPWSLMGKWICENLPDSVVLASPSKELSIVVGNRKVVELDQTSALPTFETLLRDNHVDYILTTIRREGFNVFEFFMMDSKRFSFEPVYSVANLHLMRVHSRLREYITPDSLMTSVNDTSNATYLLHQGRKELTNEHYITAAHMFAKALSIDSTLPEIYYQTIIAYSMMGDSNNAKAYYQKLFTLPQALGYVGNARMQIQAMRMLKKAMEEKFPPSNAVETYKVASLYWSIGYYKRAASVMNTMLDGDSTYFVGLLWGLHYNLQNGDTLTAKKYLKVLDNIDKENAVAKAFTSILNLGDFLQITQSPNEKSRYHYAIAKLYKQIELNEEALDEAERALRDNPNNEDAYILMAEIFVLKSNLRMAERNYTQALFRDPQNSSVIAKIDSIRRELSRKQ